MQTSTAAVVTSTITGWPSPETCVSFAERSVGRKGGRKRMTWRANDHDAKGLLRTRYRAILNSTHALSFVGCFYFYFWNVLHAFLREKRERFLIFFITIGFETLFWDKKWKIPWEKWQKPFEFDGYSVSILVGRARQRWKAARLIWCFHRFFLGESLRKFRSTLICEAIEPTAKRHFMHIILVEYSISMWV